MVPVEGLEGAGELLVAPVGRRLRQVEAFVRDGGVREVNGDAQQLEQVFLNLIHNAAHAMEGNGTLTLSMDLGEVSTTVRVSDTGKGIPREKLDQIFQRILVPVKDVHDFDLLRIPFRALATDLVTGAEVVLRSGSLVDAIRASMSIPGLFTLSR